MGKIDELIQQYCPDGVEFRKIKDVYKRIKGTPITATKMKEIANPTGSVRIFAGGKTVIDANEEDIPNANITRVPAVLVQSRGVIDVVYYEQPFTFKNEMWAYTTENKTSVKYLYYVMKSNVQTFRDAASGMGALPQISLGTTEDFEIPLPPLPVQEAIVNILDRFAVYAAELQAELQARQQQYNYYRDTLLSFEGREDVDYLAIPMFVELKAGKAIKAEELKEQTDEEHKYPCYGGNGVRGYIGKQSHNGDYPIIGRQGALCGCVNWASGEFYATEHAVVCKPLKNANSKFIYYLFQTANLNQYKSQGAQPGLSVQRLNGLVFPVPSLAEQQRIVDILDRFDTLVNDLSQGLPAEIEARQQQYEYYRDRLLTFNRK